MWLVVKVNSLFIEDISLSFLKDSDVLRPLLEVTALLLFSVQKTFKLFNSLISNIVNLIYSYELKIQTTLLTFHKDSQTPFLVASAS